LDVLYRVVGAGTHWMAGLRENDAVAGIGPLGNAFTAPQPGATAWLVSGGIGVPPLLWLARTLTRQQQPVVLFVGARSHDLVPLQLEAARDGPRLAELPDVPLVLATDDGSAGFAGTVVDALHAYEVKRTSAVDAAPHVRKPSLYACGPEVMMRGAAAFCAERGIRCWVCLERAMACGIGTCQSCAVPVRDAADPAGWRYALCCTHGPVFDAAEVLWETPAP